MEEGYILRQNATFHFNNILTNTRIDSSILYITVYLNNSFYQTSGSLILQLKDKNSPFTSYFTFSTGNTTEVIFFNFGPNRADIGDQLKVSRSIKYLNEAPVGEYTALLIATVKSRAVGEESSQEITDNSTIIITVGEKGLLYTSKKLMKSMHLH